VNSVDLGSLQDADVLKVGGTTQDRFHHVAQHGVVGLDLIFAGPACDEFGLLMQRRVGDVRDVGQ
jgi:hypothetical protein